MEDRLPVGRQGIMEYWDLTHHSIIPFFLVCAKLSSFV